MIRLIRLIAAIGFAGVLGWTSAGAQVGATTAFGKIAPAIGATTANLEPTLSWSPGGRIAMSATQAAPGAFTKAGPANNTTGLPLALTLSWNASAGASSYEYCLDTSTDNVCTNWGFLGPGTSASISNLLADTTYYWQVRAKNIAGVTYADGPAAFWAFTTQVNPGPFGKSQPAEGQLGVPLTAVISWGTSAGKSGYEYCYDTTNDGTCSNWVATSDTAALLLGLSPNTVYYWQVRAVTADGATYADGSPTAFRSFTTTPVVPPPPCNVLLLNGTTASAAATGTVFPISGSPASFTVEAWIRPYASQNSTRFQSIVADQGYSLFLEEETSSTLRVGVALHPGSVNDFMTSPTDSRYLTLDQWHHVAFVYDDVAKQLRIGVDGVLGGPFSVSDIDFAASARSLTVGSWDGILQFNGTVDNVRISSVARYASDTYTPQANLVSDADTRALFAFGEAAGSTSFTDDSGEGHTLTGVAGAQTYAGGCSAPNAPTVTSIAPNTGPTTGGTPVSIAGTNFEPGATVNIGGALATGVTVNSATSITATTAGAGSPGAVNVEVINPGTKIGTLVNGFTYFTALPSAFSKSGPGNGAAGVTIPLLSWVPSARATSYEYCIDTSNDAACAAWTNVGSSTVVSVRLASNTTYYWQVRAVDATGATYGNGGASSFWSFTTGTMPPRPDFRDFNGDGKPDLLWEHASGSRYVWFLNGATFSSGAYLSPNPMDPALAIVGVNDFTGDGKPDLLMQSTVDRTVTLFHMDGVDYVASQTIQAAQNTPWRVVATGDFNGDGKPDIVWQNVNNGQIYVWFMSSWGGLAMFGGIGGGFGGDFVRDAGFNIVSGTGLVVAGVGDIDLDGDEDLLLQDWNTGTLRVWYMNGTVRTSTGPISPGAVDPNWKVKTVGDYNGDGKADFIFEHTNGSLYIWFMDGATFSSGAYLTPSAVNPAWQIVGPR